MGTSPPPPPPPPPAIQISSMIERIKQKDEWTDMSVLLIFIIFAHMQIYENALLDVENAQIDIFLKVTVNNKSGIFYSFLYTFANKESIMKGYNVHPSIFLHVHSFQASNRSGPNVER